MGMVRIIPRLDIKGPNLVKGVHLEGLRVLGKPGAFAERYYLDGADELIYIDSVASLYGRNNLEEIVKQTAKNVYIPLTVGGGIRSVEDIRRLLRAGADKVAINTGAIRNPKLIAEGAGAFGSQCIVVSIEAKLRGPRKYECLTDNAREKTGLDVMEWVKRAVELGAGEILLTSVDREGTGKGYDVELTAMVAESVNIPVIACGGAGKKEHLKEIVEKGKADAVSAASVFHYGVIDLIDGGIDGSAGFEEGNIDFLRKTLPIEGHGRKGISPEGIREVKKYLFEAGINVRIPRVMGNG